MILHTGSLWTLSKDHVKILEILQYKTKKRLYLSLEQIKERTGIYSNMKNILMDLVKSKFCYYSSEDRGYEITHSGFDSLAILDFKRRGLTAFGEKIGVGKESDIYLAIYKGADVAVKIHRLGRTSFRTVKTNRDYVKGEHLPNWFEMSVVSARKEYNYLSLFQEFTEVPRVYMYNRHAIMMELLDKHVLLNQVINCNYDRVYNQLMDFMGRLWKKGYVHCDFNEFNIMLAEDGGVKVIDFPQCISVGDSSAKLFFERDLECIRVFFNRRFKYSNAYSHDNILYLSAEDVC